MARRDQDDYDGTSGGDDWRALDGERPQTIRGDQWQTLDTEADEEDARPLSRRVKLVFVALALAIVVGIGFVVIQWLKGSRPASMLIVGAHYDTNLLLPANVPGWQGAKEIDAWTHQEFHEESWGFFRAYKALRPVGKGLDDHYLTRDKTWEKLLGNHDFKEDTLIVFISAFGAPDPADPKGEPVIFLDDPQGKARLKVSKLLEELDKLRAAAVENAAKKKKNIVLLLDAVPVQNHWPVGIFDNGFVAALKKLDLPPDTYIICSCDEKQRSWTSEEWRSSIFARYVRLGLKGAAKVGNQQAVTLDNLFDYVEDKVNNWVLGNRDMEQTPIFLPADKRGAAKKIELVLVTEKAVEESPDDAPGNKFQGLSSDLKTYWEKWQKLNAAPAWAYATAPQLWRQCQDALLRWEHLERTGYTDHWRALRDLVKADFDAIAEAQAIKMPREFRDWRDCLSSSLPFAAGVGRPAPASARETATKLWDRWKEFDGNANALAVDKGWIALQAEWQGTLKDDKNAAAAFARLASVPIDSLLEGGGKSPDRAAFHRAAQFVQNFFPKGETLRPIEAHFLVMLDKEALPKAPPDLLAEALRVRRLAEQTVMGVDETGPTAALPSYCEFVLPLVQTELEAADKKRREGEDLVFGSESYWDEASKTLASAKEDYEKIRQQSQILRAAFAARDRAWAELPYLSQWVSQFPSGGDAKKLKPWLDQLDSGLNSLKNLTAELKTSTNLAAGERLDDTNLKRLEGRVAAVNKACDDLIEAHRKFTPKKQDQQIAFHQCEALLAVPFVSAKQRSDLNVLSRAVTGQLNRDTIEHKGEERRKIGLMPASDVAKRAKAVYAAGLDEGGKLFDALAKLPDDIRKGLVQSLEQSDTGEAKKRLRAPADYCRLIPGGRVAENENKTDPLTAPFTAPEGWRRLHVQDMLLFLANRTYRDHWYLEDETKPYYDKPAVAYAKTAAKLAEGRQWSNQKEKRIEEERVGPALALATELAKPAPLKVVALSPQSAWTTERAFPVRWKIQADPKVPPGFPMEEVVGGPPSQRKSLGGVPQELPKSVDLHEEDKPKEYQTKKVRLTVLYRGQRRSGDVEITSHAPSLIVTRSIPERAPHVAVRMDKNLRYGALSIVLDTSGSMAWIHKDKNDNVINTMELGDPSDPSKKRRYDFAVDALDEVLQHMPELEHLSVVRFYDSKPDLWKDYKTWRPETQRDILIQNLRELGREKTKDKKGYAGLDNSSPIAKAIELSMEKGFPQKPYDGPKVVLVLTDGVDNLSYDAVPSAESTPKNTKAVHKFLFDTSPEDYPGAKVVTVCFIKKDDKEFEIAKAQFSSTTPRKDRIFLPVEDGAKLGAAIRTLLRPRLELTASTGQRDPQTYFINEAQGNLQWHPLGESRYRGKILWNQLDFNRSPKEIQFDLGQDILLTVKRANDFYLERAVVAEQDETKERLEKRKMLQPDQDWFATMYESERNRGKLSQLLLLEKQPTRTGPVTQPRPEMVWLEATSTDPNKPSRPVCWQDDWEAAAPAFRLTCDDWPDIRPVKLSAFWQETFPFESGFCKRWRYGDRPQFSVGKTSCELEIGVEKLPGKDFNALVARVKHDPGNPVYIRLDRWGGDKRAKESGGWPFGQEHQYFEDVGRSTARFYPWTESSPSNVEFLILCVNSFKSSPERRRAEFVVPPGRDYDFTVPEDGFFYGPKRAEPSR